MNKPAATSPSPDTAAIATPTRPALLVSVRDAIECEAAIRGGADWIDIKDPANGPLGAASPSTMASVIATAQQHDCNDISAALGDLPDAPTDWPATLALVKVGFAGVRDDDAPAMLTHWWQSVAPHARSTPLVLAAYADHHRAAAPSPQALLNLAIRSTTPHIKGLLIDTAIKDGHGLFDWLDDSALHQLITTARAANLFIALAGSLQGPDIQRAANLHPHLIAVRGAACQANDRTATITAERVAIVQEQLASADST